MGPVSPTGPIAPWGSWGLTEPVGPAGPAGPTGPVVPGGPLGPIAPFGPFGLLKILPIGPKDSRATSRADIFPGFPEAEDTIQSYYLPCGRDPCHWSPSPGLQESVVRQGAGHPWKYCIQVLGIAVKEKITKEDAGRDEGHI